MLILIESYDLYRKDRERERVCVYVYTSNDKKYNKTKKRIKDSGPRNVYVCVHVCVGEEKILIKLRI